MDVFAVRAVANMQHVKKSRLVFSILFVILKSSEVGVGMQDAGIVMYVTNSKRSVL